MFYTENNFDIKIVVDYEKLQKYGNPNRFFFNMVNYFRKVYSGTTCEYRYNYYEDSVIWIRNGTLAYMFGGMDATIARNCIFNIIKEWILYEKTERDGEVVGEESILENETFIKRYRKRERKWDE